MMVKLHTFLLCLVLAAACEPPPECGPDRDNRQNLSLNGQVEMATEYLYNNRDGDLVKTERRNEWTFDRCGKLSQENSYDTDGERIYTKYYRYDRNNNLSEMFFYRNGIMQFRDVYWYDDNNNLTAEARYDLSGEMEDRKIYKRNEAGQLTAVREFSSGRLVTEYLYDYRERGQSVEWIYDHPFSGEERLRSTTIYDSGGNVLERQTDGYMVAEYDRGEMVRQIRYSDPRKTDQEAVHTYDYTYDSADNWIRRVAVNSEGDTVSIREREIDYAYNLFADTRE